MTDMMKDLDLYKPGSLAKDNIDQLTPWFQKLVVFFCFTVRAMAEQHSVIFCRMNVIDFGKA